MSNLHYEDFNRTNFQRPIVLNPDAEGQLPVSYDLFGCNLEHTRADIYTGLSAQMLRNRKFAGKPTACCGTAAEWYPIGEKTVFHLSFDTYTRHSEGYHMHRAHECNAQSIFDSFEQPEAGFGQHEVSLVAGWTYDFAMW